MKRFLNLVAYEIAQSKFMLIVLTIVFAGVQLAIKLMRLMRVNPALVKGESSGVISSIVEDTLGIYLALMGTIVVLIIYSVYLWGREWRGQASFIYRLWMLPGSRMQVYFAKLATIFSIILFLQLTQFVIVGLEMFLTAGFLPEVAAKMDYLNLLTGKSTFQFLLPLNGVRYVWTMAILLTGITMLFQFALLEEGLRSYGWKRSFLAIIVYVLMCFAVFALFIYLRLNLVLLELGYYLLALGFAGVFVGLHWVVNAYLFHHQFSV